MKKQFGFSAQQGQSATFIIILVVIVLIGVFAFIFILPKFFPGINQLGQNIRNSLNYTGQKEDNPETFGEILGGQMENRQSTRSGGIADRENNSSQVNRPAPVKGENTIHGTISVVNLTEFNIENAALIYCGPADIPPADQDCRETPVTGTALNTNSLWYDYSSTGHYYYNYQLIEDSNGIAMEYGKKYLISGATAVVNGTTFYAPEKWLSVEFPSRQNFRIDINFRD